MARMQDFTPFNPGDLEWPRTPASEVALAGMPDRPLTNFHKILFLIFIKI
jgi:hypothetical protein